MNRKLILRLSLTAALLSLYPICVLAYTWSHVLRSDFEGGRHGPLDAYRHALAAGVVSYTLGEWAVNLVTTLFEWDDKESNLMDRQNNYVGARIGSNATSFGEIESEVRAAVRRGSVNATDQITWLPPDKWRKGRFW